MKNELIICFFSFLCSYNNKLYDYEKYQDHFCVCFIGGHLFVWGNESATC